LTLYKKPSRETQFSIRCSIIKSQVIVNHTLQTNFYNNNKPIANTWPGSAITVYYNKKNLQPITALTVIATLQAETKPCQ